jgi:histidinol-phosphate aminotransferase
MQRIRKEIRDFSPYSPGLSIDEIKRKYNLNYVIKMASNENPLGVSPIVLEEIKKNSALSFRYPRSGNPKLVKKLSSKLQVKERQIVVGNGSDEIIDLLIRLLTTPYKDNILVFDPSFSIYRLQAKFHGIYVKYVPLNKDFSFNFDMLLKEIDEQTKLVFLTNPDNPSGYTVDSSEILNLLKKIPSHTVVIVDEAYVEFCDDPEKISCIKLVDKYDNLGVIRTFSKLYGLAGLRIGYGILPEWLADYMLRVRLPFSVNLLAEKAAMAVLDDHNFIELSKSTIKKGREYLKKELEILDCRVFPSQANFLMFKPPIDAETVFEKLLRRGIIIRPLNSYGLNDYLRVSIGREDENRRFIEALKEILKEER